MLGTVHPIDCDMRFQIILVGVISCVLSLFGVSAQSQAHGQIAENASEPTSVIDHLTPEGDANIQQASQGVTLSFGDNDGGKLWTKEHYKTPLVITAEVATSDTNIRLYYGSRGIVILDWEVNQHELRHHDPKSGSQSGVADQGFVPHNQIVTVRWILNDLDT
jgi:hypothetical protein